MSRKYWVEIVFGLLLAIGLLLLAKVASAGNVNGASALQKNATNANTAGLGLQLSVGSDFSGNTATGMTVNCTNCGGSGGAISTSVTSMPSLVVQAITVFTAVSSTASSFSLSATANTQLPIMIGLSSNGGAAAGFKWYVTNSAVAPVGMTSSSQGRYVAATTTAQYIGPYRGDAGQYLHIVGVAASVSVDLDFCKVQ